jgi:hypothetical protein
MISSSSRHAKNEAARALPSRALFACAVVTKPFISPPRSPSSRSTPRHRQVVSRLYFSFGVEASPATSYRRPRRIVFTNIDRGIRPEYAPRRQHKVAHTSLVVIIIDNHLHQQTPLRRRHHRPWSTSTPTKSSSSSSNIAQF